ncbi:ComF family protein [Cellulophaga sp. BC115SP]|nr:ComF family protein [Cellulophaga sp. BC115SP]
MTPNMFKAFLQLLFPDVCVACNEPLVSQEKHLCTDCLFDLPKTDSHKGLYHVLENRFAGRIMPQYQFAYLKFKKASNVQHIMHAIKYGGNQELGQMLGRWFGAELKETGLENTFDVYIPIPLHQKRQLERGYNQATCIADGLAESLGGIVLENAVQRVRATESQVRKKRMERFENVEKLFEVIAPEMLENKRIVIVDDTLTTGATIESCFEVIKAVNPKEISIMVLACAEQ